MNASSFKSRGDCIDPFLIAFTFPDHNHWASPDVLRGDLSRRNVISTTTMNAVIYLARLQRRCLLLIITLQKILSIRQPQKQHWQRLVVGPLSARDSQRASRR